MKKTFLLLPIFVLPLFSCGKGNTSKPSNGNGTTTISLNLSNFDRYISCTRVEGFTGVAGYSPYGAWFEFDGLLSIGIYDAVVTYAVDGTSYNFKLDASGSGKTDYFDRLVNSSVTKVSGSVSYSTPNTTIELDLSNFESYVSYARYEGFTGVAGYSPYMAWLGFKGSLTIGIYDVTITYIVDSASYNYRLDVSGGGKTNPFDRSLSCSITKVSGSVKYRL